ncbi:MAG TPA: hypothetical protein VEG66_04730 [Thermoplasmata archaeon]|jgi:thymidylate kinase|nr:hypothetical protein [Thermoplasmata archaeon]
MARRGRLVAVEGSSASGKTTVVAAAAHALGWRTLPEAFDRLDPALSLDFASPHDLRRLEETLLAEEARRYEEARRLCARGVTVLADTGFLGPLTYTFGLVNLGLAPAAVATELVTSARSLVRAGRLGLPDVTVYLRTTAHERAGRARADPSQHPPELFPRHEAVGRFERRFLERELAAVRPAGLCILRAHGPTAALARRLARIVEATPVRPASRGDALALLARLGRPAREIRRSTLRPNR